MSARRYAMLLAALLLLLPPGAAAAQDQVRIDVNGSPLRLADTQQPFVEAGTTLVPLRAIAEAVGAQVGWDALGKARGVSPTRIPSRRDW